MRKICSENRDHYIRRKPGLIFSASSEKLTRLCTIPKPEMFSGSWDRTTHVMVAKILRPLLWFGLLDHRSEKIPSNRFGEQNRLLSNK